MATQTATKIICPICDRSDYREIRRGIRDTPDAPVFSCNGCDLHFIEPMPDVDQYYASGEYRKQHTSAVGRQISPAERFEIHRPFMDERRDDPHVRWEKNWSVLEVGCSAGYFLDAVKEKVLDVQGCEFNREEADFLEGLDISCWRTDEVYVGLESQMDVACAFHVLEHAERPLVFLEDLTMTLKPGGYIYLEVPNIDEALISVYGLEPYKDWAYRTPHLWNFNKETFEALLSKAGLIGEVWNTQAYSLFNNLNWLLTGEPMATIREGRSVPQIKPFDHGSDLRSVTATDILNGFFREVDQEYRQKLVNLGIGSTLRFWGQVK